MEGVPCLDNVETAAFYRKALCRKMAQHFHRSQRRFEAFLGHFSIKEYWLRVMVTGAAMVAMVMMSTATMMTMEAMKRALAYFAAQ